MEWWRWTKKTKEGRFDLSLNQDNPNIFSESISFTRCPSISYVCLKNLDEKVNGIHLVSTKTNDAQIKYTQQLKKLNHVIKFINKKLKDFKVQTREK